MARDDDDLAGASTTDGRGRNSRDDASAAAETSDRLLSFIERYEQLESEKKDVTEQQKELMAEAKGEGFDTKTMRKIIKLRKQSPDERAEEEALLTTYLSALGMLD